MRINTPGIMADTNWSIAMPLSLEELLESPVNEEIKAINKEAGRI